MEVKKISIEDQKYLMFYLREENYGIPILKVNEIIGIMKITPIPSAPYFIKGIINLRGKIIPVMDLRLKCNMDSRDYDEQTCIIIVETSTNENKSFMGIIVDKVAEVINIKGEDVEPAPQYGFGDKPEFLIGIGKVKDKVVMLLNIESVINEKDTIKIISEVT